MSAANHAGRWTTARPMLAGGAMLIGNSLHREERRVRSPNRADRRPVGNNLCLFETASCREPSTEKQRFSRPPTTGTARLEQTRLDHGRRATSDSRSCRRAKRRRALSHLRLLPSRCAVARFGHRDVFRRQLGRDSETRQARNSVRLDVARLWRGMARAAGGTRAAPRASAAAARRDSFRREHHADRADLSYRFAFSERHSALVARRAARRLPRSLPADARRGDRARLALDDGGAGFLLVPAHGALAVSHSMGCFLAAHLSPRLSCRATCRAGRAARLELLHLRIQRSLLAQRHDCLLGANLFPRLPRRVFARHGVCDVPAPRVLRSSAAALRHSRRRH